MEWLQITLWWYFIVFFIGLIAFPLTAKIFNKFSADLGYPFAKTIAIITISFLSFIGGVTHIIQFNRPSLFLIILIIAFIESRYLTEVFKISKRQLGLIVLEEIIFIGSLIFWTIIRGQESSIHSLEKFMDFGFIQSILRSDFFPPKDIWYSGFFINYYYFGHLTGAMLIKLTGILSTIGYNLILSTIFALGITQVFSLIANIINNHYYKIAKKTISFIKIVFFGILGALIVNLAGNLHTIYLFTKGYPNEQPIPFWKILSSFNPTAYWYPNATRFIPLTIHEFPSYSYVVADLHGHVFDIPFVILTLAMLFKIFTREDNSKVKKIQNKHQFINRKSENYLRKMFNFVHEHNILIFDSIFLGFLTAVHYMTNAFDGPIYILLTLTIFLFAYKLSIKFIFSSILLMFGFFSFSWPFSHFFNPFINGIGVNCSPQFLIDFGRIGPFIFEKNNCQVSPIWMLFILWGFFWISFILFFVTQIFLRKDEKKENKYVAFFSLLFLFGTLLIIIPEFFYIKDIYPAHFRANTMFKLGYQAFIMMGIASTFVFYEICRVKWLYSLLLRGIFILLLGFILAYPFFSIPSYYGQINKPVSLDGAQWLKESYPEDKEIIDYLNEFEKKQPVILEAQGDSYSDYERISAFTGLPTVAGWWVHEWLWRGSPTVISDRIPDIINIFESGDEFLTEQLFKKYNIKYVIISRMERQKYPNLNEEKIKKMTKLIFRSSNGFGALYQVK